MPRHPIAITGMHRSGTSMITRTLHDSGLHLLGAGAEQFIDTADDNPEGFWENKAVVACNDDLLEAAGGAWDNPPALPPQAVDDPRLTGLADAATAAIKGLREHDQWGFKDPRTCLTAGFWLDLEPELRFVICVRHPLEVALSLKRRNQNSYSLGLALWERYYSTVLATVPAERRIVAHFDAFFRDPRAELARLCRFAGLEPADPHVRPDLRHHDVGVSLDEAGVSPTLQALYADLCREAGTPPPLERLTDEGTVRRLVLDGAVARRHADQRQDAIERLQEREADLRRSVATADAAHRSRVTALEAQVAVERAKSQALERATEASKQGLEALERTTQAVERKAQAIERSLQGIGQSVTRTEATVKSVHRVVQGSALRRVVRRLENTAVEGARTYVVGPSRRVVGDGLPGVVPNARAAARRLPPPARTALRRGGSVVLRTGRASAPRARKAAQRLPPPAQAVVRRGVAKLDPRNAAPAKESGEPVRAVRPTPSGPPFDEWRSGYGDLLRSAVPAGEPWLVITSGSPREVRQGRSPRGTEFPISAADQPLAHDLAYVAQLEALRYAGHRHLVLPEGSRPWFRQRAELRGHVTDRYRTVVDHDGAGAVIDLTSRAERGARSLHAEVTELAATSAGAPAVLDWTDLGVADELPGFTTFRPPTGDRLPYLDDSVEIVVIDPSRDRREAARVASLSVITVEHGAGQAIAVRDTEAQAELRAASTPRTLVVTTDPSGDGAWRSFLAESIAESGAELRLASFGAHALADVHDFDVVVLLEPHVAPLPASVEAAAALAMADHTAAVAGKVLDAEGCIEAVGGTVFSDRSAGLIANGSSDVRGPWHEYVRPVCWAPGFVAGAAALWKAADAPPAVEGRSFLREWCAGVWASGRSVRYHPTVTAVRLRGDGGEPSTPLEDSAWQRVLDLRPQRPRVLGDGEWRWLLGHDDVEACRR